MSMHDFTGRRFGNLVVMKFHHKDKLRNNYWVCQCDCGRVLVLRASHLSKGYLRSCGCPVREDAPIIPITEGETVSFDPFESMECSGVMTIHCIVTGTVKKVYHDHRWFSVEFGNQQRTSFHFSDIGKAVSICG